eukprot:TRINITY_DN5363_c0_g1_i1.p1 TRINITY_DN5363_c0_g1~~TRINITY_DN5363_c0_g1_i1.p1  ORF type:complete len:246 (-),score=38.83 TRINITY_DN5363_c0_g1_i1:15-752(-)
METEVGTPLKPYDVSTSCGRVYKNRVERPVRLGADKTKEGGDLEIETDTGVPGLVLIYNFLNESEENEILQGIENCEWDTNRAQTRRVQLYVPWCEDKNKIVPKETIKPLPDVAKKLGKKIRDFGRANFTKYDWDDYLVDEDKFTELQVNEYNQNDVLGFHKDNPIAYKEVIFGVSFKSHAYLHYQRHNEEVKVLIPARSLYMLTGESRYKWKHGIPPNSILGDKRVSFTFRHVMYTRSVMLKKN